MATILGKINAKMSLWNLIGQIDYGHEPGTENR